LEKTFAELPPSEKDAVSHRGRAWAAMAEKLGERGLQK
jgi:inosine/xanthosine triphosphate pyrophosphatase family protein